MQRSTYAVAGVQLSPGVRMNVRSHVYIPDSEAGNPDDRQRYYAGGEPEPISRRPVTIRKSFALLLLLAAVLATAGLVMSRMVRMQNLRSVLSRNVTAIEQTESALDALQKDLADARSTVRIAYIAEQQFHMISANAVESVPVTAPDTRTARNIYGSGFQGSSPLPSSLGMMSGSR